MNHHDAAWPVGQANSNQVNNAAGNYLDESTAHLGYAHNSNPYGQHPHEDYRQPQFSNLGFAVQDRVPYTDSQNLNLSYPQIQAQTHQVQYQNIGQQQPGGHPHVRQHLQPQHQQQQHQQQQQHHDFLQNSWNGSQPQPGAGNHFGQGQSLYGPATYQVAPPVHGYGGPAPQAYSFQPQPVPSPGPPAAAAQSAPWPAQSQGQRRSAPLTGTDTQTTSVSQRVPPSASSFPTAPTPSTIFDGATVVSRKGAPGEGWVAVQGCPNLYMGLRTVRRQIVTNTAGVKPHVAGDNKNGTRLLPLIPEPLPCEVLREKLRPVVEELNKLSENLDKTKQELMAVSAGSADHKKLSDELKRLELRKQNLESEKKTLTGQAGAWKAGKSRTTGKSEAAESSSDILSESSDEEEDPQELIVQEIMGTDTRPADPAEGIRYDVVRILRQVPATNQAGLSQAEKDNLWSKVIGQRVSGIGEYVVAIWKDSKKLREEKSNAPKNRSSELQAQINEKQEHIRIALEVAIEFGDDETLRNTGQHPKLMFCLASSLGRQLSTKAYNSGLSKAILEFLSRATLMDRQMCDKTKLLEYLDKHRENLDNDGKRLTARILKNVQENAAKNSPQDLATSTQPKQEAPNNTKDGQIAATQRTPTTNPARSTTTNSKPQAAQSANGSGPETARKETKAYSGLVSARKMSSSTAKAAVGASPIKRPRDDDFDSRAPKKVALESASTSGTTGKTGSASVSNSTIPQSSIPSNGQLRARPSGSAVLNRSRTAAKAPLKKAETQSSVSSTISGLLAEIAKPAEKPKPQERLTKASETAEEKARRLRKESRRGRSVTWKPDNELVQVRFFEHDSTEDEGRGGNVYDARDNRLEGQTLKKQFLQHLEDVDDEDDGFPTETDIRPWAAPRPFDYSQLDENQKQKNYVTRGGTREINSEQKKVMEEYENRELMTIYTTLSEIPDTPRSPQRKADEPFAQARLGGLPPNHPNINEIHQRCVEVSQYGPAAASQAALQRLGLQAGYSMQNTPGIAKMPAYPGAGPNTAMGPTSSTRPMTQEERDANVLSLLQSSRARNYVDPSPYDPLKIVQLPETRDEEVLKAWSIVQSAVDQCKTSVAPSPQQSQLPPVAEHTRQAAPSIYDQYIMSQASAFPGYQMQPQPSAPQQQHQQQASSYSQLPNDQFAAILQQVQALQQPQAAQTTAAQQPPQAQTVDNLASLLATLAHSAQPAPPAQPTQSAAQDVNVAAWQAWAQLQAQSYAGQTQGQAQEQTQAKSSYSHQYDGLSGDTSAYGSHKQGFQSQGQYQRDNGDRANRKDFNRAAKDHKGINRALIGTKPCTFWAKGQCAKGDSCTFRHDPNDLK